MDEAHLLKRIRTVRVTTLAAVRSLGPSDGQAGDAVRRGLALLATIEDDVRQAGGSGARGELAQARRELVSLLDERSS
jgi:hypothetical protein